MPLLMLIHSRSELTYVLLPPCLEIRICLGPYSKRFRRIHGGVNNSRHHNSNITINDDNGRAHPILIQNSVYVLDLTMTPLYPQHWAWKVEASNSALPGSNACYTTAEVTMLGGGNICLSMTTNIPTLFTSHSAKLCKSFCSHIEALSSQRPCFRQWIYHNNYARGRNILSSLPSRIYWLMKKEIG